MKRTIALLAGLAVASASFAAKPFPERTLMKSHDEIVAALGPATFTIDVKWVRTYGLPEWRDGTCYVYVQEAFERESMLSSIGEQMEKCVQMGARVVNSKPIAGARRINVYVVEGDMFAMTRVIEKIYSHQTAMPRSALGVSARAPLGNGAQALGGVYFDAEYEQGGACTVAGFLSKLGHEVKHCFDGEFHDRGWNWLQAKPVY